MHDNLPARPGSEQVIDLSCPLAGFAALVESLFAGTQAAAWGLGLGSFQRTLETGIRRRFGSRPPTPAVLGQYLATLRVQDLALACACAEGLAPAWEQFVSGYRHYLYSAAAAVIRRPADDPYVREFADSLYATLYGQDAAPGRRSLFEHFHGRSKLTTWLRAVLAQRYVDVIRRERKFDSLDDGPYPEPGNIPGLQQAAGPEDPRRPHYLRCLAGALAQAVAALSTADRARLYSYYFEQRTLAEIASQAQEHEATASRKLERLRRELKQRVRQILGEAAPPQDGRAGRAGMDEAQIQLCFEYAVQQWPFDLDGLLRAMKVSRMPGSPAPERQQE
jgi:RNA polymerase sigma factor (sigma-70 family)